MIQIATGPKQNRSSTRHRLSDNVPVISVVLNDDLTALLEQAVTLCRHRLFIATADVKDLHMPGALSSRGGSACSIVDIFRDLGQRGVQVSLLHSGVPSGPFLAQLKHGLPQTLSMRRCVRVHIKAIIADGKRMYLGSANLTGAGLGAKGPRRRNFEGGIWTDELALIDPVADMLEEVYSGAHCKTCGRREHCPVPLEEPEL